MSGSPDGRHSIEGLVVESGESVFAGEVVGLSVVRFRRPSGLRVRREVIAHPGAVVLVPVEGDHVLMVRQPREAVGEYLLELPAGTMDMPGEPPRECVRRELAEEVGRAAGSLEDCGGVRHRTRDPRGIHPVLPRHRPHPGSAPGDPRGGDRGGADAACGPGRPHRRGP